MYIHVKHFDGILIHFQGSYFFLRSLNSMTSQEHVHDLSKFSITLGLTVTFKHFQNFP